MNNTTATIGVDLGARCRGYLRHDAYARPTATHYRHATGAIYGSTEHATGNVALDGAATGIIVERIAVCRACAEQIDLDSGGVCHERCQNFRIGVSYVCRLCGQRIDDGKPCGCGARY